MTPQSFETLASLLRKGSGLTIGPDKLYLLETRLTPLLRAYALADLDALATRIRGGAPARRDRGDDHQRKLVLS
jgi:chemotaxis protein methyltransferase CheR